MAKRRFEDEPEIVRPLRPTLCACVKVLAVPGVPDEVATAAVTWTGQRNPA